MKAYDWRLIVALSLPGPAMGVLTLLGVIPFGVDRWFWLAISVAAAVIIAKRIGSRAFVHGAIVGFLLGATSKLIQAAWSDDYLANNPGLLGELSDGTDGLQFRYRMMMLVPFVGVVNGALVGLMSYFTFRAAPRRREDTPREPEGQ